MAGERARAAGWREISGVCTQPDQQGRGLARRLMHKLLRRELLRGEEPVALTTREFALLQALVTNPNRPLGRDRLIELAKGREHGATDRSVDAQVMRLRRKIEDNPSQPRHIQTVWGVGYVFVPDAPAGDPL